MDSGWKQRYRDTLASSADWVNGTRSDLTSGDPYRIARGTAGVVVFASNFVPVGRAAALAKDAGDIAITQAVEHAPQIERVVSGAVPTVERFVTEQAPRLQRAATEAEDRVLSEAESLPSQIHHYATNKSQAFTAHMQSIADQYGLKLDEAWNKEALPHLGRHPNESTILW